jgi:hypothetical protein
VQQVGNLIGGIDSLAEYKRTFLINRVSGSTLAENCDSIEEIMDLGVEFKPKAHARELYKIVGRWKLKGVSCDEIGNVAVGK